MSKLVKIADCITKVNMWNPNIEARDSLITYIDIAAVDKDLKKILQPNICLGANAPSRARQIIQKNDILVSTVRPNLNSVALVTDEYSGATASTGYTVLRPLPNILDSNYLFHWVKNPVFINEMVKLATGQSYPAVSDKIIGNSKIPLPPLEEQRRISAILDQADALRQKRQQSLEKLDQLLQAAFIEMFGDPISNPKGWEIKNLKDLSTKIQSGNTPKGGAENYVEEGIIFLRSQNVWKNRVLLDDVVFIDENTHKKMSGSSLKFEDILMTKTGRINTENSSLGRAAIYLGADDSANINGHVYLIRMKKEINKYFTVSILTLPSYYEYIRSICVGGIDKRQVNKEHLEYLPIIQPPIELQDKFEKISKHIEKQKKELTQQLEILNNLFNGLQQKAFTGRL